MADTTISYKDMNDRELVRYVMETYIALAVVQQALYISRQVSKGAMTEDQLLYAWDAQLYIDRHEEAITNAVDRVILLRDTGLEEGDTHYIEVFYEEKDKLD